MLVLDRRRFRRGFSLVEILVAVLLIGILMAVAAPRLLGARENASDSAAQQQLTQVAAAAEFSYLNSETFSNAGSSDLQDDVPDIALEPGNVASEVIEGTSARTVSVDNDGQVWTGASLGGDGRCWFLRIQYDDPVGDFFAFKTSGTCNADSAPAAIASATDPNSLTSQSANTWNAFDFPAAE